MKHRYRELEIRLSAEEVQRYQALDPEVDLGFIVSLMRELNSTRWGIYVREEGLV